MSTATMDTYYDLEYVYNNTFFSSRINHGVWWKWNKVYTPANWLLTLSMGTITPGGTVNGSFLYAGVRNITTNVDYEPTLAANGAEVEYIDPDPTPTPTPTPSPTPAPTPIPGLRLNNTFVKASHYYYVNLHGHSTMSGYTLTPLEYMNYHRNDSFAAAALTDYWGVTGDPGATGISFIPGTEWESNVSANLFQHGDTIIIGTGLPIGQYSETPGRHYGTSTNYYNAWSDVRAWADTYNAMVIFPHMDASNSWNYSTLAPVALDYDLVEVVNGYNVENLTPKYDPLLQEGKKILARLRQRHPRHTLLLGLDCRERQRCQQYEPALRNQGGKYDRLHSTTAKRPGNHGRQHRG